MTMMRVRHVKRQTDYEVLSTFVTNVTGWSDEQEVWISATNFGVFASLTRSIMPDDQTQGAMSATFQNSTNVTGVCTLVLYSSVSDEGETKFWCREVNEFFDGRFERVE